jgi:hypothetical protein
MKAGKRSVDSRKSQMLVGDIVACCYYSSLELENMAQ